jgi:hypothetical protein
MIKHTNDYIIVMYNNYGYEMSKETYILIAEKLKLHDTKTVFLEFVKIRNFLDTYLRFINDQNYIPYSEYFNDLYGGNYGDNTYNFLFNKITDDQKTAFQYLRNKDDNIFTITEFGDNYLNFDLEIILNWLDTSAKGYIIDKYAYYCQERSKEVKVSKNKLSNVYLIRNTIKDVYKIGVSMKPKNRFTSIQTSNSDKLELVVYSYVENPYKIESKLHKHFVDKKISGEWFDLDTQDVNYIKDVFNNEKVK